MIKYSQYFTNDKISKLFISTIGDADVNHILELGIGDGALSLAALSKWPDAHVYGAEIDENKCVALQSESISIKHVDVLSDDDIYAANSFDLALCNPPFHKIIKNETFIQILEEASFSQSILLKQLSADIIFVARSMIMLKDNGILALILPDGLLTRYDLKGFRKDILDSYKVEHIIQLPNKAFEKTEAKTHIVIIKKCKSQSTNIPLSQVNLEGNIDKTIYVNKTELYNRMDFSYYNQNVILKNEIHVISNMHICRGTYTYCDLKKMPFPYVHSKSFTHGSILINKGVKYERNKSIAHTGDILMVRVGSRCLGRVMFVKKGSIIISDCIYKISVPQKYRYRLFKFLCSDKAQNYLHILAHGVCAKVINKTDLVSFINQMFWTKYKDELS